MRHILGRLAAVAALVVVLASLIGSLSWLRQEARWPFGTGTDRRAFLNATWGMAVREVERANRADLVPRSKKEIELDVFISDDLPLFLNLARYSAYEQTDLWVWGQSAEVEYLFFDNRLFEVLVRLHGTGLLSTRDEILRALEERFSSQGELGDSNRADVILNRTWSREGEEASFHMIQDERGGVQGFLRLTDTNGVSGIRKESERERKSYL